MQRNKKKKVDLSHKRIFVKKGDIVKIITGDDKNKTGEIIKVDIKRSKIKVQGIKMLTHFIKPKNRQESGQIVKKEGFIHVSNVKLEKAAEKIVLNKHLKLAKEEMEKAKKLVEEKQKAS